MVHDELGSVVSVLCAKFPARRRKEVADVVGNVYEQLAASATITAHLIPLTLNRSRRVLGAILVSEKSGHAMLASPIDVIDVVGVGPFGCVGDDQGPQTSPSARA
jgi:hypothetical protein